MMPSTADPTARTIIVIVITRGDSWGWTSSVQRFWPWKVMTPLPMEPPTNQPALKMTSVTAPSSARATAWLSASR